MSPSQTLTISLPQGVLQCLDARAIDQLQTYLQRTVQTQLQQQVEQLTAQIHHELYGQIQAELRAQIRAEFEAQFDGRVAHEVALKVQQIIEQNRLARHRQFGASSEAGQGWLFNEPELLAGEPPTEGRPEDTPGVPAAPRKSQGARGHRRALPPELPRIELLIDVPEDERRDASGASLVRIGEEVSEQLDIIPMKIRVIRTIRPKYAPAAGDGAPVVAALPASILPRSNFTAGFVAMLLVTKYADGVPLARMGKVLARHGVEVPRQSLARTAIAAAGALQPLANLMRDVLLEGSLIHMDETPVQVLKVPGKAPTSKCYMWVQTGGLPGKPVVMFDYEASRAGSVPLALLDGWHGYLMTDGYAGYEAAVAHHGITHLACMAHARRKFVEAERAAPKGRGGHTAQAQVFFARLYRIEKRVRAAPDSLRLRVRQKLSGQTLDEFHAWLIDLLPKVPPKTKLGEAIAYTLNLWQRLARYIERGDLPIDNNVCERAIRPFVIGRKAWLFADTQAGARASALVYSLIETAKANGREPYAWLLYVLERLPLAKSVDEIEALLPWNVHDQDLAMNLLIREQCA
nr:IS66 family transposase [Castellaniella caeni]